MIGVIPKPDQLEAVEEFFQLFKTPWEFYRPGRAYPVVIATSPVVPNVNTKLLLVYSGDATNIDSQLGIGFARQLGSVCLTYQDRSLPIYTGACAFDAANEGSAVVTADAEAVGMKIQSPDSTVIRLGYDLFHEAEFLLANAQPLEHAQTPTLDIHIGMLRNWILEEGISFLEIPPVPAGSNFVACLTHDIDFVGIRSHKFDHTMLGFVYRSTIGALGNFLRGKITASRLFENLGSALSLPFVYLGWARDFWEPFEWYLKAERGLKATYFLIPFKRRTGDRVPGPRASRRASSYDVNDLQNRLAVLQQEGCELGVHGLDAWHSAEKGRAELERLLAATGQSEIGIRIHWLLQDAGTSQSLDEAGFTYDSTAGYNETIGYRNGTTQVFRPLGARRLLELPLHIQDGALFFPGRLNLSESQAEARCQPLIDNAIRTGGVLTVLWHDRSHGPERFWGAFYLRLLEKLRSAEAWFAGAGQVVTWFRKRREVQFERLETPAGVRAQIRYEGGEVQPPFRVRVYAPVGGRESTAPGFVDVPWDGKSLAELELRIPSQVSRDLATVALS